jgi:flagellar motor switch protein FliN/FliY
MPDEITPDESLDEQSQSASEVSAVNAVADQAEEAVEEAGAETPGSEEASVAESQAGEEPAGLESRPELEDEFPDLSHVKVEETMASRAEFQQLSPPSAHAGGTGTNIDLLLDVKMPVAIELGRTEMAISEILTLGPGSVVELDKLAGEPVDLLVNDKIVARGEVVVVDENFGVRITMLMSPEERLKSLAKQ